MKVLNLGKKSCLIIVLFIFASTLPVKSQSAHIDFGADMVSSYVWRGYKQAGASIQPTLSASVSGFSLSAWASTDFTSKDGKKEVDFTAAYENGGLRAAVTDYWWDGESRFSYFGSPRGDNNGHYLEAALEYTFPEAFPLSVAWNSFLLGKGNKKEDGKNSYSTFIELAYPFSVAGIDMKISTGFTPWESAVYDTDHFSFTTVALSASKRLGITDSFSLPIFGHIICNPNLKDIHFVFGISLKQ
jgi:hypothetical protein